MNAQNKDLNNTYKFLPWIAALAIFMQSLDGTILNTALPSIAQDMNRSPLTMQSIIISYVLILALLIPLSGWLSDRFGSKKIFIWAVGIFHCRFITLCPLHEFRFSYTLPNYSGNWRLHDGSGFPSGNLIYLFQGQTIGGY
ncbi:major facilitator transporter [Elizabethkingia anophelis R26]|nr:major facilitator transporter [Elizabethkingia anophelis R26]